MRLRSQLGIVVAALVACGLVGCGGPTPAEGVPSRDAGSPRDPDSGAPGDAGTSEDAGQDAGGNGGFDAGFDAGSGGQDGGLRYHPAEWSVPDAGAFHGKASLEGLGACTTCHGPTLTGGTVQVSCDQCHSGWKTNCTFCHGSVANPGGAPPRDVLGRTATTEVTVGAHTSHVSATHAIASPLGCVACHPAVTDALSPGHVDPSPAEVTITGWARGTPTCTVYCHGAFTGGTSSNVPSWTQVDGAQAACGTCHAAVPTTGSHPSAEPRHAFMGANCTHCHLTANSTGTAITRADLHVNGVKDAAPVAGTWNATTLTCSPSCHGPQPW